MILLLFVVNFIQIEATLDNFDPNKYLIRFGYLPLESMEQAVNIISTKEAIINFQNFVNITTTGILDKQTIELMKKPRCGNMDNVPASIIKQNNNSIGPHLTTWSIPEKISIKLNKKKLLEDFKIALSKWEINSNIIFKEIHNNTASNIFMSFQRLDHGDGFPFDGIGNILGHAFYPNAGALSGRIHIDADENWSVENRNLMTQQFMNYNDFYSVIIHEIGHALGLVHSNDRSSIMFPWYKIHKKTTPLPKIDVDSIQKLYGYQQQIKPRYTNTYLTCIINNMIFLFKRREAVNFITIIDDESVQSGAIKKINYYINYMFPILPKNIIIDAVYQRPNKDVIIFSGIKYYIFRWHNGWNNGWYRIVRIGFLYQIGIPRYVKKITAAGHFLNQTFLFTRNSYFHLDENKFRIQNIGQSSFIEQNRRMTLGLKSIAVWHERIYFIKLNGYWDVEYKIFYPNRNFYYDGYEKNNNSKTKYISMNIIDSKNIFIIHLFFILFLITMILVII